MRSSRSLVIATHVFVACGGSDGSGGPTESATVPLTELCVELARVDCVRLDGCGALKPPFDLEECERRQRGRWCAPVQAALQAAVDLGELEYDDDRGAACREAVGLRGCGPGFDAPLLDVPACRAMVEPLSGESDPCQVSLSCGDGLFCAVDDTCPGTCVRYAQNNEPCGVTTAPCAPDLYCSVTGMRCRARASAGAACEAALFGTSCRSGFFCDTSQPGQPTCAMVRGRNQGCTRSFECIEGARCVDNRCSAGLEGDVCRETAGCRPGFQCVAERCVGLQTNDAPCSEAMPCGEGLVCTSTSGETRCLPQAVADEPCGPDVPCYLGRCVDGVCVDLAGDGEACGGSEACLPGRECDGVCRVNRACF